MDKKKLSASILAMFLASSFLGNYGIVKCEAVVRKVVKRRIVISRPIAEQNAVKKEQPQDNKNAEKKTVIQEGDTTGTPGSGEEGDTPSTSKEERKIIVDETNAVSNVKLKNSISTKVKPEVAKTDTDGTKYKFLSGDVTGDGKVTGTDLSVFKRYFVGNPSGSYAFIEEHADLNNDGKMCTATDLSILKSMLLNFDEYPAYPATGMYTISPVDNPKQKIASAGGRADDRLVITNNDAGQIYWYVERIGSTNCYKITADNTGMAWNTHNGVGKDGNLLTLWQYGGNAQQYRFMRSGDAYYIIGNVGGVFPVTKDGNYVNLGRFNNGKPQKWILSKVVIRDEKAQRYATVYSDAALLQPVKGRWIDKDESYTVLKDVETALYVKYKSARGEDRYGYVTKNIRNVVRPTEKDLENLYKDLIAENEIWDENNKGEIGKSCFSFANYVFKQIYGVNCGWDIGDKTTRQYRLAKLGLGVEIIFSSWETDVAFEAMHNFFSSNQIKAGDFIQGCKNRDRKGRDRSQHSMIFVSYDSQNQSVRVLDANRSDTDNLIQLDYMTLDEFVRDRFPRLTIYSHD